MRRLIVLLAVVFAAMVLPVVALPPSVASSQAGGGTRGDVNCDATVDIVDALMIAQYVVGNRADAGACPLGNPATELVAALGDVNYSQGIDIVDALEIAQCAVGVPNFACALEELPIPQPLAELTVSVDQDGFVPIPAGDRIYAIGRAGDTIACADRLTNASCWEPRSLLDGAATGTTMALTRSAAVGSDIYFLIRDGGTGQLPTTGSLRVACWDMATDGLCAVSADISAVSGAIHIASEAVYVFTEYRRVHCFQIPTLSVCPGYEVGAATALLTEPEWVSGEGSSAWHSDAIAEGDRIYATLADSGAVWLQCWDAAIATPCVGFDPSIVNDTRFGTNDDATAGRLFFHRSASGDPISICSQGERDGVDCRDLGTGAEDAAAEAGLSTVASAISYGSDGLGISTYHSDSNRQLFVGTTDVSTTYCHDFDTNSYCGSFAAFANGADTGAYGYAIEGSCAVGLGDAGYLYFMDPASLSSGCAAPVALTEIEPCQCPALWPRLKVVQVEGLSQFLIDVRDENLNQVALIDALADGTVDLNEVVGDAQRLRFIYSAVPAPGQDPWADGEPPTILFS